MDKKLGRRLQGRPVAAGNIKLFTACGALLLANKTKRTLFLLRDNDTHSNTWGLVGGRVEEDESVIEALHREIKEEIGYSLHLNKTIPLELFKSDDGNFEYHTFVCLIDDEFIPNLSDEHKGYCWCAVDSFPKPLHPGLYSSLNNVEIQSKLKTVKDILEFN
jgi:8-oxo-dGTP pyrophosphatase MutT (NUDIX family)